MASRRTLVLALVASLLLLASATTAAKCPKGWQPVKGDWQSKALGALTSLAAEAVKDDAPNGPCKLSDSMKLVRACTKGKKIAATFIIDLRCKGRWASWRVTASSTMNPAGSSRFIRRDALAYKLHQL